YEAKASTELRKSKRAEAALDRAALLAPNDFRTDLQRAELRERQADLPGAIDALTKARTKNPKELQLAFRLGYLESQAGRLEDAEGTLKEALNRKFEPSAAAELAFVKFRQEQPAEALKLLKSALSKDRSLAKGYYYLGAVLYRQGDAPGAEKAYRDADRLSPEDPRALASLCQMQAQRKDTAGAEETKKQLKTRFADAGSKLAEQCKAE
ncbi:MAG: tetratricopeptide repeat protein, partial [Myxococcaceae bacterium]